MNIPHTHALKGYQLRMLLNQLKREGHIIVKDNLRTKAVEDVSGQRIFSCMKHTNIWDCKVHESVLDHFKKYLSL
jgi:hypothetical protein